MPKRKSRKPSPHVGKHVERTEHAEWVHEGTGIFRSNTVRLGPGTITAEDSQLLDKATAVGGDLPPFKLDKIADLARTVLADADAPPGSHEDAKLALEHAEAAMRQIRTARELLEPVIAKAVQECDALRAPTEDLKRAFANDQWLPNEFDMLISAARFATDSISSVALHAALAGIFSQRLPVRAVEGAAKIGREYAFRWRGHWLEVSDLERRILEAVGNANNIRLHEFIPLVWRECYDDQAQGLHRERDTGMVRTALAKLNKKLRKAGAPMLSMEEHTLIVV